MIHNYPLVFILAAIVFWLSVSIIFYSYVLFPLLLKWLVGKKSIIAQTYKPQEDLPCISLLIAAYNEQEVIAEKIRSIYSTTYPLTKIEVLVGSDASTDQTNEIVGQLSSEYPNLRLYHFTQRRGKGNVINELHEKARGSILIFTDANVMLDENTLFELVKYFRDERIGLVDSQMVNTNMHPEGISFQERAYIAREVQIKQFESILWGTMMGPFGGCFAIRKAIYEPVPKNFLVDDFYLNMKVLERGYRCINNLKARVYEDVSNNLSIEFKRKIRISTGNFQNLRRFSNLLWHKTKGLSFCFISHKALRWIGPLFLLVAFIANSILAIYSSFYFYIFILHCFLFVLPLLDLFLKKAGVNNGILRFVTHFYSMNLALLAGFIKSLNKIESNVWKPTQRNQA